MTREMLIGRAHNKALRDKANKAASREGKMTDDDYRAKSEGIAEMIGDLTDVDVSLDPRAEVKPDIDKTGAWVQVWMWVPADQE